MTTFKELAEAWIASREHCSGSLGRIRFWVDEFGPLQVDQISEDQVDQAINRLVARGKLKGGTGNYIFQNFNYLSWRNCPGHRLSVHLFERMDEIFIVQSDVRLT